MKIILVTIATIVLYISKGNGAPVNETEISHSGVFDLKTNVSRIWELLTSLKTRLEILENRDVVHSLPSDGLDKVMMSIAGSSNLRGETGDEEEDDEDEEEDDNKGKSPKEDEDDDDKMIKDSAATDHPDNTRNKEKENCKEEICNPLAKLKIHRRDLDYVGQLFPGARFFRISKLFQEAVLIWRDRVTKPMNIESVFPRPHHGPPPSVSDPPTSSPQQNESTDVKAYCSLRPNKALPPERRFDIRGKIYFTEKASNSLVVHVKLTGLLPSKTASTTSQSFKHGFHVHQFGNLNNGCESTGAHWNPFNKTHGAPNSTKRHLGDLGNIETDINGSLNKTYEFDIPQALTGPHSFIGKAIVVHEKVDDLGSNPSDSGSMTTGNAGSRLACCIIYKLA